MRVSRWCARLVFSLPVCLPLTALAAANPNLDGISRIVFLGDSITYSGQYIEFVEAYFVSRFPERHLEFINLGLPSETVSGLTEPGHAGGKFPRPDLHERLERVLRQAKPDLVVACYGMNDGIYYPFGEDRFERFQDGIRQLRERCATAGAEILHVTPPTFDPVPIKTRTLPAGLAEYRQPYEGYNEVLDRYSEWLLGQRARGWEVADVHGPMNRYLTDHRRNDPKFFLAGDGVHANATGHWIIAKQVLLHLGVNDIANAEDVQATLSRHHNGAQILNLIQQRQRFMKDAWLTATGHTRPGMRPGLPLPDAEIKAGELDRQIRAVAATVSAGYPEASARLAKPGSGPIDAEGRPLIRKLGTIDLDLVETTPIVLNGRLWRFEWVRHGIGQQYWDNHRQTNYFRFRDPATGEVTPPFADGHEFGSAFVHDGMVYVTGTQGRNRVSMFASRDLRAWETWPVLSDARYGIFNTSLCRAQNEFVLMFEIDKPREEAGVAFTARFAKSRDLRVWTLTQPECNYAKDRYTAPHCLRWLGGWFYDFYLEAHNGYEMRVVRSRDLIHWESSRLNPVLRASPEDRLIANSKLTEAQRSRIANAVNLNNSDIDFCEWHGRLIINYSWGNQQGIEHLAEAVYDGSQAQFLQGWFPDN